MGGSEMGSRHVFAQSDTTAALQASKLHNIIFIKIQRSANDYILARDQTASAATKPQEYLPFLPSFFSFPFHPSLSLPLPRLTLHHPLPSLPLPLPPSSLLFSSAYLLRLFLFFHFLSSLSHFPFPSSHPLSYSLPVRMPL